MMVILLKIWVFWDVMLSCWVKSFWYFKGWQCRRRHHHHHQGQPLWTAWSWRDGTVILESVWELFTQWHIKINNLTDCFGIKALHVNCITAVSIYLETYNRKQEYIVKCSVIIPVTKIICSNVQFSTCYYKPSNKNLNVLQYYVLWWLHIAEFVVSNCFTWTALWNCFFKAFGSIS